MYQAHAFHEQFNRGRTSGNLIVSELEIAFSNGEQRVSFPVQGAEFKLGGASDRLVYVSHPNYPDWVLYTSDRSILKNPILHNQPLIQKQLKKAQAIRQVNWSVLLLVIFTLLGAPLALLFNIDKLTAIAAREVPPEWEKNLGESAFAQYQISHDVLETDEATEYLKELTLPLLEAIESERYTYTIVIASDSTMNAFALPGGYIVINSGLIMAADDANEILGVLAHEISHVSEQHGVRNVIGTAGTFALVQALVGDVSGLFAIIANAAPMLINQSYSRGFETEADEKGLLLLDKANINPQGMVTFFEKIKAQEQAQLAKIEDEDARDLVESSAGFLSSHPATDVRIKGLQKRIGTASGDYRNLDHEFRQLKTLVEAFVTNQQGNN